MTRDLQTRLAYEFQDGSRAIFTGRPSYRLSNSWRDACDQAKKECEARGEVFDPGRASVPRESE